MPTAPDHTRARRLDALAARAPSRRVVEDGAVPRDEILGPDERDGPDEITQPRRPTAGGAVAAYRAAHGAPLVGFDDELEAAASHDSQPVRVGIDLRTATVGTVVLLALSAVVVWLALTRAGGPVVPLADVRPSTVAASSAADAPDASPPSTAAGADADGAAGTAAGAGGAGPSPSTAANASGQGSVVVHVAGHVRTPGLVTLPPGSRIADAITAAGGADGEADLGALNLARLVVDGEQVLVPAPGDPPGAQTDPGSAPGVAPGAATGGAGGSSAGGTGSIVDVNTADVAALDTLPGVGPVLAQRIVDHRTENGPFTSVDDLAEVSGIGPAVLAKIRDHVRT